MKPENIEPVLHLTRLTEEDYALIVYGTRHARKWRQNAEYATHASVGGDSIMLGLHRTETGIYASGRYDFLNAAPETVVRRALRTLLQDKGLSRNKAGA